MSEGSGEFADCGRFSGDGEEVRPSVTANKGVGLGRSGTKLRDGGRVSPMAELRVTAVVENPFLRVGLDTDGFLRLEQSSNLAYTSQSRFTHAGMHAGSREGLFACESCSSVTESLPVPTGVVPVVRGMKGALCGSGDISMGSFAGPGEDDGIGGVVELSVLL